MQAFGLVSDILACHPQMLGQPFVMTMQMAERSIHSAPTESHASALACHCQMLGCPATMAIIMTCQKMLDILPAFVPHITHTWR